MFSMLPESRRVRRRATTSVAISAAVHVAIIAAAAFATAAPPPRPRVIEPDTIITFQQPPHDPQPTGTAVPTRGGTATRPADPPQLPPVETCCPVIPPVTFPDAVLPIDSGSIGEIFSRDTARVDPMGSGSAGSVPGAGAATTLPNEYADRPAVALPDNPTPRYPEMLRAANVGGSVTMRFVIDSVGRVSMRTVEVRHSDHELFTAAVLAILPRVRFVPAEANGRRVRVLVEQRFEFRLTR